jgi:hypothetical protein
MNPRVRVEMKKTQSDVPCPCNVMLFLGPISQSHMESIMRTSALLLTVFLLPGCNNETVSMSPLLEDTEGQRDVSEEPEPETETTDVPAEDIDQESSPEDVTNEEQEESASPCSYPLVELRTGKDTECQGGNSHQWPIGMDAEDCHGWSASDTSGGQHKNSAKDIRCNEDGSFQFTQYAGNITCQGNGVTKVFVQDECEQDIPPVLYTFGLNLACCSSLDHPDCKTGIPTVSIPNGSITLNGEACQ